MLPSPKVNVTLSLAMVTPGEKVNVTRCPTAGFAGAGVIERFESASVATAVNEVPDPEPPKLHAHEVGPPVDWSVNWTTSPTWGCGGVQVNTAVGAEVSWQLLITVTLVEPLTLPPPATPLPVTVYVPGETYECVTVLQPPPIWQNEE